MLHLIFIFNPALYNIDLTNLFIVVFCMMTQKLKKNPVEIKLIGTFDATAILVCTFSLFRLCLFSFFDCAMLKKILDLPVHGTN